ncbi:MAG: class I SAM-dependent methyltransferase [Caldimonas sp.]
MKSAAAQGLVRPSLRTAPLPHCLLCGSAGKLLHADVRDHFFHVPGSWNLKRCLDPGCALVWQDPMVIADDMAQAYDGYYTSMPDGAERDLGASFYRLDRWVSKLLKLEPERRRHAAAYLDDAYRGKLLDVGCGSGEFASMMRERGWAVQGTEFDLAAARTAETLHGIHVDIGELSAIRYPTESFDALTARHVLEHVREPVEFLAECWRIIRPGGRLVVVTPNVESLGHRHFADRWRGLEQPRHLFLYGSTSLRALFQRIGVQGVGMFTSAQGCDYVLRTSFATSRGLWRSAIDYLAIWRLQIAETVLTRRSSDVGEELVAIVTKPGT